MCSVDCYCVAIGEANAKQFDGFEGLTLHKASAKDTSKCVAPGCSKVQESEAPPFVTTVHSTHFRTQDSTQDAAARPWNAQNGHWLLPSGHRFPERSSDASHPRGCAVQDADHCKRNVHFLILPVSMQG